MVSERLTKVELEEIKRQIKINGVKGSSEDREEREENNHREEIVMTGGQHFEYQ